VSPFRVEGLGHGSETKGFGCHKLGRMHYEAKGELGSQASSDSSIATAVEMGNAGLY